MPPELGVVGRDAESLTLNPRKMRLVIIRDFINLLSNLCLVPSKPLSGNVRGSPHPPQTRLPRVLQRDNNVAPLTPGHCWSVIGELYNIWDVGLIFTAKWRYAVITGNLWLNHESTFAACSVSRPNP